MSLATLKRRVDRLGGGPPPWTPDDCPASHSQPRDAKNINVRLLRPGEETPPPGNLRVCQLCGGVHLITWRMRVKEKG